MKNKQPQNVIIVRDLPKNTHRDAVLEKLLVEVNMKIKSFQDTLTFFYLKTMPFLK